MAATVIRGDPKPSHDGLHRGSIESPVGLPFPVTVHVGNPSYVASGVQVDLITLPPGVTPIDVVTTRLDGVTCASPQRSEP